MSSRQRNKKICVICGRFFECRPSRNTIDWHLISPDGRHFRFRSLREWLRKNGKKFFDVEPNTRQFDNVFYGLSRVKKSMLGNLPTGQRPGYTYKGWRVIPTEYDIQKNNGLKN